jgi:hypothetical protein
MMKWQDAVQNRQRLARSNEIGVRGHSVLQQRHGVDHRRLTVEGVGGGDRPHGCRKTLNTLIVIRDAVRVEDDGDGVDIGGFAKGFSSGSLSAGDGRLAVRQLRSFGQGAAFYLLVVRHGQAPIGDCAVGLLLRYSLK